MNNLVKLELVHAYSISLIYFFRAAEVSHVKKIWHAEFPEESTHTQYLIAKYVNLERYDFMCRGLQTQILKPLNSTLTSKISTSP